MSNRTAFNCTFSEAVENRQLNNFQCDICLNIIIKPVTLKCGHSECQKCLKTLADVGTAKCPRCRVSFEGDSLAVNTTLDEVTSYLPLKCDNPGCHWAGVYEEAEAHSTQCPKLETECVNENCHHVAPREKMPDHTTTCPKQKVPCPDCKLSVTMDLQDLHRASQCPNSTVMCPLACGTSLPRNHVNLHLHVCNKKVELCTVPGCKSMVLREQHREHVLQAAESHNKLQSAEIQRLHQVIHEKKSATHQAMPKEKRATSFLWQISDFLQHIAGVENTVPLTSPLFSSDGNRWRAVLTNNRDLFLQLVSAAHPVTVEIRIVMRPGDEEEDVINTKHVTLKEGEMWGVNVNDINKWVNGNGTLPIKFIIYELYF